MHIDDIEREAASIADAIAASKARAMRYQAGDKDLIAAYMTAQGQPTTGDELDLPYEQWQAIRNAHWHNAIDWRRGWAVPAHHR